ILSDRREKTMRIYFSEKVRDFPKKAGDLHLAWYQNGRICISRKLKQHQMQVQNFHIIQVNQITKAVWETLNLNFRRDLARYASQYKKTYPGLRKRGISAYSAFLIVIHALVRRFGFDVSHQENAIAIFEKLLDQISVYKLIQLKILKEVRYAYRFNQLNGNDLKLTYQDMEIIETDSSEHIYFDIYKDMSRENSPPVYLKAVVGMNQTKHRSSA
ncbi:MAG TPA: hypothetical protein PKJ08_12465, partial [Candidatus Cloacimonadota bacterium]|nr:hypothetical protein [Candidatus Cloacimonadota bacterium]